MINDGVLWVKERVYILISGFHTYQRHLVWAGDMAAHLRTGECGWDGKGNLGKGAGRFCGRL